MDQTPLRHYLRVLRRRAWLIVVMPVIAIAATAIVTMTQDPVYRASTKLVVGQVGSQFQPSISTQALTQTMTNLIESEVVATTALEKLGLDVPPSEVVKHLHTAVRPDSTVIEVTYDWGDKEEGLAILSGVGAAFESLVAEKLLVRPEGPSTGTAAQPLFFARTFDPPHLEQNAVSPNMTKNLAFAAVLGLALGLVFAFVREALDDRIRSRHDAEQSFGSPVIGALPGGAEQAPVYGLAGSPNGRPGLAEALAVLRGNIEFSQVGLRGPVILVTSAGDDEGKAEVVANLGAALALGGRKVVCIEADHRRPRLHEYFAAEQNGSGWVDVVGRDASPKDALTYIPLTGERGKADAGRNGSSPGLYFLGAGTPPSAVEGALRSDDLVEAMADLSDDADFVILDAPPLLQAGDSYVLALHSDTVLIAARQGRTRRESAEAVRTTLHELGASRVAVVLTAADRRA